MYSIINILIKIVCYQCLTTKYTIHTYAQIFRPKVPIIKDGKPDCYVDSTRDVYDHTPMPFAINNSRPYIIRPGLDGNYHIKHNTTITVSCVGTYFISPQRLINKEVLLKCVNGSLIYQNNVSLPLSKFECRRTPKARLFTTSTTCQNNENNRIMNVGFDTTQGFITSYKICFDIEKKNTLYSWVYIKAPIFNYRHVSEKFTRYTRTNNFNLDEVVSLYKNQTITLGKILNSEKRAFYYIKQLDGRRYLVPCHLSSRNLFHYIFEADATFFYENTAPQWIEYSRFSWKELEMIFRKNLIRGSMDHVIVTGTYRPGQYRDNEGHYREFYLQLPDRMRVPQYFWKLYFDTVVQSGTVFIELNNPYQSFNPSVFFCKNTTCPSRLKRRSSRRDLVFCCTLEEFEKVYGKIDPVVFKNYLAV